MPYSYVSLTTAKEQLAQRLYDPNSIFWSDSEKTYYIVEAIRTWNAHTSFWRSEFILNLSEGSVWYDIADDVAIPNTIRPFTITDDYLYRVIQHHLLEPATGSTWTGSLQFNAQDLLQAVQRRRDELLSNTGCTISRDIVPAIPGRTFLDDKTIDIRRNAWLPVAGFGYSNTPLWPDDEFAIQSYGNNYTTRDPGTPTQYRQSTQPPLSFDVDTEPAVPGSYEVLSVKAGADLSVVSPTILPVPDDYTWIVKFGAMADLLNRDSNAKDVMRAQYCNLRYKQGQALLFGSASVLFARVNNLPMDIDSVQNTDNYRSGWQAQSNGQPDLCMTAGLNMVGFARTPDSGPYGITLTVVQNAPVPIVGGDTIQVGRDAYDAILDYAVHLASFKMGGLEFLSTLPLYQRFMTQATLYNSKLDELGEYTKAIYEMSQLQAQSNPVFATNDALDQGQV